MSDRLEKIRSILVEVLDQASDVSRVAQSGPWPAFVLETTLWTPRRVLVGPVPADLLPLEDWTTLRRIPGLKGLDELYAFGHRPDFPSELIQVTYGRFEESDPGDEFLGRSALIDENRETGVLDRSGYVTLDPSLTIRVMDPGSEILDRWQQVERALDEDRRKQREARGAAIVERNRRNDLLCQALLRHLASSFFACPHCRHVSQNYRFLDSYFVCWSCGRSFFPVDLPAGSIPDSVR